MVLLYLCNRQLFNAARIPPTTVQLCTYSTDNYSTDNFSTDNYSTDNYSADNYSTLHLFSRQLFNAAPIQPTTIQRYNYSTAILTHWYSYFIIKVLKTCFGLMQYDIPKGAMQINCWLSIALSVT
jgi:hypothetical protein